MIACLGDKTLVETIVEIEFAASCIPLVKSKVNAINMIKIMSSKVIYPQRKIKRTETRAMALIVEARFAPESGILYGHAFKYIGYIFTPVQDTLHMVVNFAPLDKASNIC